MIHNRIVGDEEARPPDSTIANYPHDNPIKPTTHINLTSPITRTFPATIPATIPAILSLVFTGCNYEVPITDEPTRKIEEKLLGDWKNMDEGEKPIMKVRKMDDSTYLFILDNDAMRAFHSDVSNAPFLSV